MLEAVERGRVVAVECAESPVWSLGPDSLVSCLDGLEAMERSVAAAKLHVVREIDGRGIAAAAGARTPMWLAERLRMTPVVARRLVRLAQAVDDSAGLDHALSAGRANVEQVTAIARSVDVLPPDVGVVVKSKAEARLLGFVQEFDAQYIGRLGERVLDHVAPHVAEEIEAKALSRHHATAHEARTLSLRPHGDGRVRVTGWLDTEMAAVVSAAVDPLCSPRHRAAPNTGPAGAFADAFAVPSGVGSAGVGPSGAVPSGAGSGGSGRDGGDSVAADHRTYGQRRADALVDVCRLALNTGELPDNGGDRPQLTVTVRFADLRDQVGAATLDTGDRLTPAVARRLACDAHVLPVVLGSHSQVLDVGQSRRLITGALRRALVARDHGCAFPTCDRPPRWTEGHHIVSWVDGGPTSLQNSVLLCRPHHRTIHHSQWTVRLGDDQRPDFIAPAHLDPHQRPRRNLYHHRT